MLWFVLGLIFVLAFLLLVLFAEGVSKLFSLIPLVLAVLFIMMSTLATVGPRNIGVENIKGRTTGENHGAGWVVHAPWVSVTDIDASIQPEEYKGDDCIKVKIADGSTACVSASYNWRVLESGADEAFKDFNNKETSDGDDLDILDAIRAFTVSPKMKATMNEVWGTFDPTSGIEITPDMTAQQISEIKLNVIPNYADYNDKIQANVDEKIKDLGGIVQITGITVSAISYSEATQSRIETIKNKILDSKAAMLDVAIKNAQAQGNVALADSLKDPNVLVSKCLDGLIEGDFTAPAGFQCWPGNGGALVLPSAK